jgi:3-oxoacyl-[acyl-carrier protein] reductase
LTGQVTELWLRHDLRDLPPFVYAIPPFHSIAGSFDMPERSPVVLISGGGTGVGAAAARLFAARGWSVAINYHTKVEEAEAVAQDCRAQGVRAVTLMGDVSADADCRRMVDVTVRQFGRLDALVNSAGVTQFTKLSSLDEQNAEDFHRVFATNAVGAYQLARAAGPHLRAAGNSAIVSVSSIAAMNGNGSSLAYIASKGALNSLTLALARLYAPSIRVNAVLPGLIDTGWFAPAFDNTAWDAMKGSFAEASALGTICSADDVAAGVLFLVADAPRMTGQLLVIDAGYSLGAAVKLSR